MTRHSKQSITDYERSEIRKAIAQGIQGLESSIYKQDFKQAKLYEKRLDICMNQLNDFDRSRSTARNK